MSTGRDNTLRIWDAKSVHNSLSKNLTFGICCGAGSQRVVSTSRDNTLRVWDAKKGLAEVAVMKHNNNTGRWISPFRAIWGPASDAIVVGNMGRQVNFFHFCSLASGVISLFTSDLGPCK